MAAIGAAVPGDGAGRRAARDGRPRPERQGRPHPARPGRLTVVDGPFTESKELVGGFAVLQAGSKAEAVELGRRFMQVHADILGPEGVVELGIREMFDPPAGRP